MIAPQRLLLFAALALVGCGPKGGGESSSELPAARGKTLILRYGCATCHVVPGIPGNSAVGPSLDQLGARKELAGSLPHTEDNLVLWIRNPRAVVRNTAMPTLGVTEADARAIVAYLYEAGGGRPSAAKEEAPPSPDAATPTP